MNTIKTEKFIFVTFQKEGVHKYPFADKDPNLATKDQYDVSFLGYPHRHIFHFKVWIGITHNNRDLEFIQVKRWIENLYAGSTLDLNHKSCEMMSDDLYGQISAKWPGRDVWIEVSEDNENGSFIKYQQV
jgi:hypothetical protein